MGSKDYRSDIYSNTFKVLKCFETPVSDMHDDFGSTRFWRLSTKLEGSKHKRVLSWRI